MLKASDIMNNVGNDQVLDDKSKLKLALMYIDYLTTNAHQPPISFQEFIETTVKLYKTLGFDKKED